MTVPMTVREGETVRDVPTVYLVEQQGPSVYGHTVVGAADTVSTGKALADQRARALVHDSVGDWVADGIGPVGRSFSREVVWARDAEGNPTDVGWQHVYPAPVEQAATGEQAPAHRVTIRFNAYSEREARLNAHEVAFRCDADVVRVQRRGEFEVGSYTAVLAADDASLAARVVRCAGSGSGPANLVLVEDGR